MSHHFPEYLSIKPEDLGRGTPVKIDVVGSMNDLANHFAQALFDEITSKPNVTMILPVGPVDQYPILADMINQQQLDCRDVMIIAMDEYLTDDDQCIDIDHPLSFCGFLNRKFYDLVAPKLAPLPEHRVFPDPNNVGAIQEAIDARGGLDACYGGIGINGHIAFNEPQPELSNDDYAALPTRVLQITPETRTINSNTVGGEISIIPHRCVTVGMKQILAASRLRFYCNRPWQSAVVRRVLHNPITPACPASFLRTHGDASISITDYVAAEPDIQLR